MYIYYINKTNLFIKTKKSLLCFLVFCSNYHGLAHPTNDNSYQIAINFSVDMSEKINLLRKGRSTMKIQHNKQNALCQIHVLAPTHAPFHTERSKGRKTKTSKSYLFADTFKINFCP